MDTNICVLVSIATTLLPATAAAPAPTGHCQAFFFFLPSLAATPLLAPCLNPFFLFTLIPQLPQHANKIIGRTTLPRLPRLSRLPRPPRLPLTWRDRRGERRSCERGREQALPDEESTGITGGESGGVSTRLNRSRLQSPPPVMPALDPSGNASSRSSDNASSRLSRNCRAPPSGHTSARPLRSRQPSPPPVIPALAPLAMPALALSRDSCTLPSGHGSDHHTCGRQWSSARPLTPAVAPSGNAAARPLP